MGDVVNLNAYRKRQEREAIKAKAGENRVRHGRKRAAKRREQEERDRANVQLDGKKLDPNSADDGAEGPKRGV